jgi:hypothetical protein
MPQYMPYIFPNCLNGASGRRIRILNLEPACRSEDKLYGTLEEIPLDGWKSYDAISYVWGTD